MSDVYFSTNPNDWVAVEGVSVNRRRPDGQVKGVDVNRVALVGKCVRGPSIATVGSPSEFLSLFGGRDAGGGGSITGQVWKAMLSMPFSFPLVVARVTDSSAVKASANAPNVTPTNIIKVEAITSGTWANGATYGLSVEIVAATDADANHFDVIVKYQGTQTRYRNLNCTTGNDNCSAAVGSSSARLVNITKLADGRPLNTSSDIALSGGTDGTVDSADYITATQTAARLAGTKIVTVCEAAVDESGQDALNAAILTLATELPLVNFVTWDGIDNTRADEITAKLADIATPTKNVIWCFNSYQVYDSQAQALVTNGPHILMACILSQTDADINPGEEDNVRLAAGIKSLTNESLARADYILLKAAGVSSLEKTDSGFQFRSAIATDTSEIADVRCEQYLIESIANALKHDVKKTMTASRRRSIPAKVTKFLSELQKAERIVGPDDEEVGVAFNVKWVDTFAERSANLAKLLTQVRTMAHFNYIVLETDIGTGVTVVK